MARCQNYLRKKAEHVTDKIVWVINHEYMSTKTNPTKFEIA
jgi:hypothetical protein